MRTLVRCSECQRGYDATGSKVGRRFRCHCGNALEVEQAKGHTASVVRCSSCGGAVEGADGRCGFCESVLTIHERDLQTVCPGCFARVSDKAKFCHHCGVSLAAEQSIESVSDRACPVCVDETKLNHRSLNQAGVSALECSVCAGLWLSRSVFDDVVGKARDHALPDDLRVGPAARGEQTIGPQEGPMYRRCVTCESVMARQNYGRSSGVIVDVCASHGIWFDAHELDAILRWIQSGGLERADKRKVAVAGAAEKHAQSGRQITGGLHSGGGAGSLFEASSGRSVSGVEMVATTLLGLFFEL